MKPLPLPARLLVTWLAIFPLVVIVQFLLDFLVGTWPPLLMTALTLALVVPIALLWAVPLLSRWYAALFMRSTATDNP